MSPYKQQERLEHKKQRRQKQQQRRRNRGYTPPTTTSGGSSMVDSESEVFSVTWYKLNNSLFSTQWDVMYYIWKFEIQPELKFRPRTCTPGDAWRLTSNFSLWGTGWASASSGPARSHWHQRWIKSTLAVSRLQTLNAVPISPFSILVTTTVAQTNVIVRLDILA